MDSRSRASRRRATLPIRGPGIGGFGSRTPGVRGVAGVREVGRGPGGGPGLGGGRERGRRVRSCPVALLGGGHRQQEAGGPGRSGGVQVGGQGPVDPAAAGSQLGLGGAAGGQLGPGRAAAGGRLGLRGVVAGGQPGGRADSLLLELVGGGDRLGGHDRDPRLLGGPGALPEPARDPGRAEEQRSGDRHGQQRDQLRADRQVSDHLRHARQNLRRFQVSGGTRPIGRYRLKRPRRAPWFCGPWSWSCPAAAAGARAARTRGRACPARSRGWPSPPP